MRNKKAKALRSLARRFAAMESKPDVEYVVVHRRIELADCMRRVYKTMKRRYKETSWQ